MSSDDEAPELVTRTEARLAAAARSQHRSPLPGRCGRGVAQGGGGCSARAVRPLACVPRALALSGGVFAQVSGRGQGSPRRALRPAAGGDARPAGAAARRRPRSARVAQARVRGGRRRPSRRLTRAAGGPACEPTTRPARAARTGTTLRRSGPRRARGARSGGRGCRSRASRCEPTRAPASRCSRATRCQPRARACRRRLRLSCTRGWWRGTSVRGGWTAEECLWILLQ